MKSIKGESFRFVIAGGINTLATYLLYLALLPFASYPIAFSISFVAGVFLAYALNARFVFRAPLSFAKMMRFPLLYFAQYVVGLLLLKVLVDHIGVDERLAPLVNVLLLTPLTFVANRWFLAPRIEKG